MKTMPNGKELRNVIFQKAVLACYDLKYPQRQLCNTSQHHIFPCTLLRPNIRKQNLYHLVQKRKGNMRAASSLASSTQEPFRKLTSTEYY